MQPIISLHEVTKIYKTRKEPVTALCNISLEIMPGEMIAITGQSGSGKSSLLNIIGCLDKPTYGSVIVDQTSTHGMSDRALSRLRNRVIGFVFQFFHLQPHLTVADNLGVPAMFNRTSQREIDAHVKELLQSVGLEDLRLRYPRELSGGQMQRIAIARALMNNPKILLADEPTGNLDAENVAAILELFSLINRQLGTTVIIVTHDLALSRRMQRVVYLDNGRIVQ